MSSETLPEELKDDNEWVVYENVEDFKDQICSWIDASVEEGFTEESKVLSLKKDGRMYFNFRDIRLRNPDEEYSHDKMPPIHDLLIEIENVEEPNR